MRTRRSLFRLAGLAALLAAVGCASYPVYRPPVLLVPGRSVEIGVGPHVGGTLGSAGGGGTLWGAFRTESGFDVFGAVHGSGLFAWEEDAAEGWLFGGGGMRYRMPYIQ